MFRFVCARITFKLKMLLTTLKNFLSFIVKAFWHIATWNLWLVSICPVFSHSIQKASQLAQPSHYTCGRKLHSEIVIYHSILLPPCFACIRVRMLSEKQSTYQFLWRSSTFWAFVMQRTNERIQCAVGKGSSEWIKQKNHCTFLEVIKTQVQLNSTWELIPNAQRHELGFWD